jgi:hypothetical protein
MSRAARGSLVAALAILVLLGLLRREDPTPLEATTRGTMRWGFRALHDLLAELGFPVERTREPIERVPREATLWLLAPRVVAPDADAERALRRWVAAGGTLLVALAGAHAGDAGSRLLDVPVPPRTPGAPAPIAGEVVPRPRRLAVPRLSTFAEAADWTVQAAAEERPFVLARALGAGRLVVVADDRFLRNGGLDGGDAAPLAVDLARAFGAPRFHEGAEAGAPERSAVRYLARSPALAVVVGLALTGVLFAWRGQQLPARVLDDATPPAPSLEAFVDGLAALYAGTRDHARVLARYRELTAGRLRRHFGLPPDTPLERVVARLGRDRRLAPGGLALLADGAPVADEPALRGAVATLDALAREATT